MEDYAKDDQISRSKRIKKIVSGTQHGGVAVKKRTLLGIMVCCAGKDAKGRSYRGGETKLRNKLHDKCNGSFGLMLGRQSYLGKI